MDKERRRKGREVEERGEGEGKRRGRERGRKGVGGKGEDDSWYLGIDAPLVCML